MTFFGHSAVQDFVLCFALGIAFAAIVVIGFWAVHLVMEGNYTLASERAWRVVIFLVGFCVQFLIATAIGDTKSVRDENSILGFVVAICVVGSAAYILRRHFRKWHKENKGSTSD